ncbi:hypothetical protein LEN26_001099 [Aphanomyces euteiches]|nr:hypothetical protein AeMF1_004969 [Aphanomyces euteiches]KAH9162093.1 hypothetical protein LEN26_001099 [Aphanomyces euteiches]KAH9185384.1 hypothetical protein AeNC1_012635 [Aphanomyces euteiches]
MSDEETKAEALALTDEERQYREALKDVDDAREKLEKANQELENWKMKGVEKDDEYRDLKKDVDDAKQDLKDAKKYLKYAHKRWKDVRAMIEKANQAISLVNEVKRDAERKRKAIDSHCEAKKSRLDIERESAESLMSAIRDCNMDGIFDIESILELTFPSLLVPPNRFNLNKRAFKYQARSDLKPLYDKIVHLWTETQTITVNVVGTSGYGKSHMLAVLVLLLLKSPIKFKDYAPPFVCYIPDCRELLDYTGQILTIEDIRDFMEHQNVILVADQWNSIDENSPKCTAAVERLGACFGLSVIVEIHGISMNANTWRSLLPKPTAQENNVYYGGLKDNEFDVWLKHHPNIFTENKDKVALLTGKLPLLLTAFARVHNDGDSWESIVQRVQLDTIVKDIYTSLKTFYAKIDGNLVRKLYTQSIELLPDVVDFRFFYEDGGFCATSEIVRRLLYCVWRTKTADDALLKQWRDLVLHSRNQSTLGFDVEEIIKAMVCQEGVVEKYPKPDDGVIIKQSFKSSYESETLKSAIEKRKNEPGWMLLVPENFNYPGVDMILVTDTTLVGISVTMDKNHSKLTPFFDLWRPLAESHGMEIKGLFVAPDNFVHEEDNVETVFFEHVFPELWRVIKSNPGSTYKGKSKISNKGKHKKLQKK